jgi:hypothetical protein
MAIFDEETLNAIRASDEAILTKGDALLARVHEIKASSAQCVEVPGLEPPGMSRNFYVSRSELDE